MKKNNSIFFTPEEKNKNLEVVIRKVKRQVKRYKDAKKAGTLRKVTEADKTHLFNV